MSHKNLDAVYSLNDQLWLRGRLVSVRQPRGVMIGHAARCCVY